MELGDLQGRAEMIRLCLIIGDIPFEDERFAMEDWPEVKLTTPYRSVPVITVNGEQLAQSMSILRYCGKIAGLYPTDALEALKADEIADSMGDLANFAFRNVSDPDLLLEIRRHLVEEEVPRYFGAIEERITRWSDGPYALGEEISIADLAMYAVHLYYSTGWLEHVPADVLDGYPRVMKAVKCVTEHPRVVAWYKEHPILRVTKG